MMVKANWKRDISVGSFKTYLFPSVIGSATMLVTLTTNSSELLNAGWLLSTLVVDLPSRRDRTTRPASPHAIAFRADEPTAVVSITSPSHAPPSRTWSV